MLVLLFDCLVGTEGAKDTPNAGSSVQWCHAALLQVEDGVPVASSLLYALAVIIDQQKEVVTGPGSSRLCDVSACSSVQLLG